MKCIWVLAWIDEDIYIHYGQETRKIVDCSEAFITT